MEAQVSQPRSRTSIANEQAIVLTLEETHGVFEHMQDDKMSSLLWFASCWSATPHQHAVPHPPPSTMHDAVRHARSHAHYRTEVRAGKQAGHAAIVPLLKEVGMEHSHAIKSLEAPTRRNPGYLIAI
jgi:hypothetical protein